MIHILWQIADAFVFFSVSRFVDVCNNLYLRILITEKIYDKEFDGV